MPEDPIIVKPGFYSELGETENKGICVVIDNQNSWDIRPAQDGSIIVIIPPDSKWVVTTDHGDENLPPEERKKKAAILRRNGTLDVARGTEHQISYTHPDD